MTLNFRSIISMFFLMLVLVMSSGLTIYSRSCEEGCAEVISLSKEDVDCQNESEEPKEESCCKKEAEIKSCCAEAKHEHKDDDCCNTEAFSFNADFYSSFYTLKLDILVFENIEKPSFEDIVLSNVEVNQFANLPPPDLGICGKHIILKKNSFLI